MSPEDKVNQARLILRVLEMALVARTAEEPEPVVYQVTLLKEYGLGGLLDGERLSWLAAGRAQMMVGFLKAFVGEER